MPLRAPSMRKSCAIVRPLTRMLMCAFSFFVKVRFAMSSIHCEVRASSPRRLRSSSSNLRSSASRSTTGNDRLLFMLSTFMALPSCVGREEGLPPPEKSSFRRVRMNLHGDDPLSIRCLATQLHEALRSFGRLEVQRGHRLLVLPDALANLVHLGVDRGVPMLPAADLLGPELHQLEALPVDRVLELPSPLSRILQALLVQLERVDVRPYADLDAAARLVGVDVVERGVGGLARLDDRVDEAVRGRVVPALEGREIQDDHVRVTRCERGRPHLLRAVDRVVLRPDVIELER